MTKPPFLFCISGVKNSGKTTLITKLLPVLTRKGFKVATIKHDGHDFQADVPGTDTYAHLQAGAYGTAIFSDQKFMVVKKEPVHETKLWEFFPEADIILMEGFKNSPYPKMELVRKGNSVESVCPKEHLMAVISDFSPENPPKNCGDIPVLPLDDVEAIAEEILLCRYIQTRLTMVILAGGLSSRMGTDKADLMYHGRTFLEHQIEKGRKMGIREILISGYRGRSLKDADQVTGKDPKQKLNQSFGQEPDQDVCQAPGQDTRLRIIPDRLLQKGPLGGMEACLRQAEHEHCLVISVDCPLLSVQELKNLVKESLKSDSPATILQHGEKQEPLMGIYRKTLAEAMEQEIRCGKGSVFAMLKRNGYQVYKSAADDRQFQNINDAVLYQELVRKTDGKTCDLENKN